MDRQVFTPGGRRLVAVALALVAVAGVAACTPKSSTRRASARRTTSTATSRSTPTRTSTSTPTSSPTRSVAASPSYIEKSVTEAQFSSPSKNIGCVMAGNSVWCDIGNRSWTAPQRPSDCQFDYGNGARVTAAGAGTLMCASDTALGASEILNYGYALRMGQFLCVSTVAAMRCQNDTTGHGFTLAVEAYTLF